MPSFVARVERPERGGEWIAYLERRRAAAERWVGPPRARPRRRPRRTARRCGCSDVDGDEERCSPRCSSRRPATSEEAHARGGRAALGADARARLLADLVGERANRRHRPGRGFEALRYRFEIVSDYGAFRDLQRHRMLTVQWQALTPDLGADVPEEVAAAGVGEVYERALERSARRVRAARRGRARRGRAVRALPRLPDPLRARPQRARGDAPDRAALRPRGPSGLPRGRARDARADRRRAPGGRRGDDARRHGDRAAARADPQRDAPARPRAKRPAGGRRCATATPDPRAGNSARVVTSPRAGIE